MNSKIVDDLVVDKVDDETNNRANAIMSQLGDFGINWVWSANWSNSHPIEPPSGFSLVVDYNAPLISDVFHPEKLFSGVSAYKLESPTIGKDKIKLDEAYLHNNSHEILESMKRNLKPQQDGDFDLSCMSKDLEGTDSKSWTSSLSGTNSFAGIYTSKETDGYYIKTDYWLLVQSGVPKASNDIYNKIYDHCNQSKEEKPTWENYFNNNKDIAYVRDGSRRNRDQLLCKIAKSVKLNTKCEEDTKCMTRRVLKLNPSIETFHYSFTDVKTDNSIIYHSNTASPSVCNGMLLMVNPYMGGYIMKGDTESGIEYGKHWSMPDNYGEAFPTCTGRVIDNASVKNISVDMSAEHLMEKVIDILIH